MNEELRQRREAAPAGERVEREQGEKRGYENTERARRPQADVAAMLNPLERIDYDPGQTRATTSDRRLWVAGKKVCGRGKSSQAQEDSPTPGCRTPTCSIGQSG